MYGCRVIRPGHTFTLTCSPHLLHFREKFFCTAAILLILGLDIALAYGLYRLAQAIFW